MKITKDILVEDIVEEHPDLIPVLKQKGIVCVICGEPVWGNLEETAKAKGKSDDEIDEIIREINLMAEKKA